MQILTTLTFYTTCWLIIWSSITIYDHWRSRSPSLTFEKRLQIQEEKIPTWGWIGGLIFFLILFVLVPFVGFAADLT